MKALVFIMMLVLISASCLFATVEEKNNVQDNGGGRTSGGAYDNVASIGQAIICMSSGGAYDNCAGFLGSIMGAIVAIEEQPDDNAKVPREFSVGLPSPNPFNSITRFSIEIPQNGLLKARFYDVCGRMVYGENKDVVPGKHVLDFESGNLPSGTYLYRITFGNKSFNGKMVLIK